MNFLIKSLAAFIFFVLTVNISLATETTQPSLEKTQEITIPINAKMQTDSLFKKIYSKVAKIVKSGTNFVENNPKKCLVITAAIISSAILYWYLSQPMIIQPSKTLGDWKEEAENDLYKTFSECPNNKALEEAMINLKKNNVQIDYSQKPATPFEKCVYHDAGNQSIRHYCNPEHNNENAQNIHLLPAEMDYIHEHGNQSVKQAIDYLKTIAASFCNQSNVLAEYE